MAAPLLILKNSGHLEYDILLEGEKLPNNYSTRRLLYDKKRSGQLLLNLI